MGDSDVYYIHVVSERFSSPATVLAGSLLGLFPGPTEGPVWFSAPNLREDQLYRFFTAITEITAGPINRVTCAVVRRIQVLSPWQL